MKNAVILMLSLVAGTASFAQSNSNPVPAATVAITSDQKVKLIVGRENALANVVLRDALGHTLYSENVNLKNGLRQYFNILELALGTYQVEVSIGKESVVKTFVVDEQPAQKLVAIR